MTDTDARLAGVEQGVGEIKTAINGINESLQLLSRLEERHQNTADGLGRAFIEIKEVRDTKGDQANVDDHEKRLRIIEQEMPMLREIKRWVVMGVLGIVALVGIALTSLVVVNRAANSPTYTQSQPR